MKRYRIWSLLAIHFLIFNLLFMNCRFQTQQDGAMEGGTGVGNPLTMFSSKLLSGACESISRCHSGVTRQSCENSLAGIEGLDYQVGLPTGHFSRFKSVMEAEFDGRLTGDPEDLASCLEVITGLSCESPQMRGAYQDFQQNPFWGSPRIFLQKACAKVLRGTQISADRFHYIRAGAKGTGDGSDWENACPGFVGTCAGDQLKRGHTYYVAAGDYSGVTFSVSGSELITVKKATTADHGTRQGWVDSFAEGPAVFPWWSIQSSHWVIDGQSRDSLISGHGFQINPPRLNNSCNSNFCNAIVLDSGKTVDRVTLRYIEVVGFGVDSKRHLNGLYSVPLAGTSSNIVLYGVSFHDFGIFNGNSPVKISGKGVLNLTVDESSIVRSAASAISDTGSSNVVFRNSWFENIADQGVIVVAGGNVPENWTIHGNIFWQSKPESYGISYGIIQCNNGSKCLNWTIANNTISGFSSAKTKLAAVNFLEAGPGSQGNQVVNNIWDHSVAVGVIGNPGVSVSSDYNLYASCSNPPDEPNGAVSNDDFFINRLLGDFRLTVATAPGLPLASPLDRGRDGVIRGRDGIWDRGAFELENR